MNRSQRWLTWPAALLAIELGGCRRSPTFNILGSFFPAWLLCLFAGIILSVISNRIFARFSLDKEILWPVVVYPCIALFAACALWLIFFS
ncbi:MAG: YtcA family lipoprotein [Acidobacteriaceae bacterium]